MNAKEYLKQIRKLDTMIRNKIAEQQQWKNIALGIVAHNDGERVQSSGNQQKMANAVERYVDIEAEINESIDKLVATKQEVIETIERLDVIEYDLLHMVYVQYFTLEEVANKCGNSYSWATTVHGRALKNVQKILDSGERNEDGQ